MSARRFLAGALLASVLAPTQAGATTITLVNLDGAGEGFNDPRPVAPVGGNVGTTLGAQMIALATTLDNYNNGANTPTCTGPR